MKVRNVLVAGGAGYVGAHTCKLLAESGYLPITFDKLSTGHKDFVRWGPLIVGDIRDSEAVAKAIVDNEVSSVLHFAAHAYVGESVTDPQKYYENNVAGTVSLLKGMLAGGCKKLVFSSTCAIYGEPDRVPISEETQPNPVNPYGASKLMVERILRDYHRAYDLCWIALRYFNAAGADIDAEIGEMRDPETHLIPRAMMMLQGHVDNFEVYGSDFPTLDGTAVRDYVHVTDLASAHVSALKRLHEGRVGNTALNLGTGVGYSVRDVLKAIEKETGEELPTVSGPRREGDPAVLVAEVANAKMELGFEPRHSDLETIVRTAWAWHRKAHPRMKRPRGQGMTEVI